MYGSGFYKYKISWKYRRNNKQKQDIMLKLIPILFATLIFLEVFCETNNYEWFWKINFATKALPYFLMGYLIKKNNEKILDKISFKSVIASGIVGLTIALVPVIFSTKIRFSMVGIIIYSVSLFIIAIKLPSQKKISGCVEYVGDNLSLDIYIFHIIVSDILVMVCRQILNVNTGEVYFQWMNPMLTLMCTIILALCIKYVKKKIKSISNS